MGKLQDKMFSKFLTSVALSKWRQHYLVKFENKNSLHSKPCSAMYNSEDSVHTDSHISDSLAFSKDPMSRRGCLGPGKRKEMPPFLPTFRIVSQYFPVQTISLFYYSGFILPPLFSKFVLSLVVA